MNKQQLLRQHVINILDDAQGISTNTYDNLRDIVFENAPGSCDDIFNAVAGSHGRYFLPDEHGLVA